MTGKKNTEDLPKIVASVMIAAPGLVFKTGWAYLRMRKRAHKVSKQLEQQFVTGGIPPVYAEKLAERYASELSIRRMARSMDIPFGAMRPPQ